MKNNLTFFLLGASLIALLCGCGLSKKPMPAPSPQPETEGEPLDITAFSFYHTGSDATSCFRLNLTREDGGVHLYAEELFSGGRIADTVIESDALEQLGKLAGTYRVDGWNGFDKSKSNVMDGSRFSLDLTLADGSTISAHGNNAFPNHYSDVYAEILALYTDLMEQYGTDEEGGNAT